MNNYKQVVEALLNSANRLVKVACLKEDPDVILGYSILSADFQVIDFVFVKTAWRKNGIGRSLIPQFPSSVSHLTALGQTLLHNKLKNTVFNPFTLS